MSTDIFNNGDAIRANRFGSGQRRCACGRVPRVMTQVTVSEPLASYVKGDQNYVQMCFSCFTEMAVSVIKFAIREGHVSGDPQETGIYFLGGNDDAAQT